MRNTLIVSLVALLTVMLFSFASSTSTSNKNWLEFELPPSKISHNGSVFFEGKLSKGRSFSVYADDQIEKDASFYHTLLWQDFGWRMKDDKTWTAPYDARERKLGHIYVSISRGVAVYYYPDRTYSAFKVEVVDKKSKSDKD